MKPFARITRLLETCRPFVVMHSPMSPNRSQHPRTDLEDAVLSLMAEESAHQLRAIVGFLRSKAALQKTERARIYIESLAIAIEAREFYDGKD